MPAWHALPCGTQPATKGTSSLSRIAACFACVFAAALHASPLTAQESGDLQVYLDCTTRCFFDYIRTEITYVDWMRDRADADVHIIVSDIDAGAGREYSLRFIGTGASAGRQHTLTYYVEPNESQSITRAGVTERIELGLVPFLIDRPAAARLSVDFDGDGDAPTDDPVQDPWRAWVFEVSAELQGEGEESYSSSEIGANASAYRITENWKVSFNVDNSYSEETFELSDSTEVNSIRKNWGSRGLVARSITPHLSLGVLGSLRSNSYENLDLTYGIAPAIEYNLFPYSDFTRRQAVLLYTIGANRVDYNEITIFEMLEETLYRHTLTAAVSATQPWGELNFSAEALQYLHDLDERRIVLSGGAELQLVRGFELEIGANFAWIGNQRSLPLRELSDEEVLTRGRLTATDFSYRGEIGLSYTFGSRTNRVVNPRLDRTPGDGGYVF